MAQQIAIVSYNAEGDGSGFWQADLFATADAHEPETFFTMKTHETRGQAVEKAKALWPEAAIQIEDDCIECNGSGEYDDGDGPEPCCVCDGSGKTLCDWWGQ